MPDGGLELVIADDGSQDGTWEELTALVSRTGLPVLALRLPALRGPLYAAQHGGCAQPGPVPADDRRRLPTATASGRRSWFAPWRPVAFSRRGRHRPAPDGPHGVWDRTIWVPRFSGLFETCNLGFDRQAFLDAGGFPVVNAISHRPRGFGEDVLLGVAVQGSAEQVWVPSALVHHRWLPSTFAQHLEGRRRLAGFPFLIKHEPSLRKLLWHRFFLTRRSAAFDLAALGVVISAVSGNLFALLAVAPWCSYAVRDARTRPGRPLVFRLPQVLLADATAAASLAAGSIKHQRAVL